MSDNPYESPPAAPGEDKAPACTFCGRVSTRGTLVQATGRDVYTCASCARIGQQEALRSQPVAWSYFVLGVFLIAVIPVKWFLLDDMAGSIVVSLVGLICLVYFLGSRGRWEQHERS